MLRINDIIQLPKSTDIINTSLSISLYEAIDLLNSASHNGFTTWAWSSELQLVIVNNNEIRLSNCYYYILTESQAILIAKAYKDNEQAKKIKL